MFTGIVESVGKIEEVVEDRNNLVTTISSDLVPVLKVDQSISHNGVCLTVEEIDQHRNEYKISAIHETLSKTTLGLWKSGDLVNLERSVSLEQRLDGHIVQGHVDGVTECIQKADEQGSVVFSFKLPHDSRHLVIPRGSITLDGISLTIARITASTFSVAIIPYTLEHTIAHQWNPGSVVNVEYDVFGKYMARYRELYGDQILSTLDG